MPLNVQTVSEKSTNGSPVTMVCFGKLAYGRYGQRGRAAGFDSPLLSSVNIVPSCFRDSLKTVDNRSFSLLPIHCHSFFYPRLRPIGAMPLDEYDAPHGLEAKRGADVAT